MNLVRNLVVVVLGLTFPVAIAADERPIVVVFNVEARGTGLSEQYLNGLADYLTTRLTESGAYQVVPRDQVKQRLFSEKKKSYKECYDQSCQIEIGKELAAEKTLAAKVIKLGNRCTVTLTLYDLKKSTTESAASQHGECGENKVIDSVDKALDKLFGERAASEKEEASSKAEAEERERLAKIEAERTAAEEKARGEKFGEIKQPGVDLYWQRCPLGQRWTGSSCEGEKRWITWHSAMKACPIGYRLPTRKEFMNLLEGCDSKVRGGRKGHCNSCTTSSKCSSMFGKDGGYYSSSSSAGDSSNAWFVRFARGDVSTGDKDGVLSVRCLRSGS